MKRLIAFVLAAVMCLTLCACGAEKQTVKINFGEDYQVELKNQQDGIVWESSNADIAVIENGVISGVGPGEATLSASKDGKNIAKISVSVNLIDITAILFSQKTVEVKVDEEIKLQYVLMPDNASDYGLSWKSANTEIVEVDDMGNVRGINPGTTTVITSTAAGIMDTCEVTVKEPSAIEQLNEYEKWLFDVMVEIFLPSFYNAPAVRLRKIESMVSEDYTDTMILLVNIQGTNKFGGTLYKDYNILCKKNIADSTYLPMFTDDGLYDRSKGGILLIESTKMDYTKINAALEEYWEDNMHG